MSKYVNLDNLKTFLRQLKTHITDPIKNDVSTLTTKVRNAENNIQTANSNISSVQQALNDKVSKNSKITFPNDVGITSLLNDNREVNLAKIDNNNNVNIGSINSGSLVLMGGNGNVVVYYDNTSHTVYHSGNINNNKFAYQVNVKNYIGNPELLTYVDTINTQMQFKKSGLYKITVTKPRGIGSGISFCDTSLDFETRGNVLVGYNVSLYQPKTNSLVIYIDKTKTYEFFGFVTGTYQGATTYTKQRGTEFKTNLQGTDILIELIKEC